MIWHIFKKDWKLVWPFVLIVSAVHWIGAAIVYKLGEDPMLGLLAEQLPALALFASMFLIGAIVHVDAIPGARFNNAKYDPGIHLWLWLWLPHRCIPDPREQSDRTCERHA